jgi:hypothetical protein
VGLPFETGFESDVCRYLHNGPAIGFVTGDLKKIRPGAFSNRPGVRHEGRTKTPQSVLFRSNLSASVAPQQKAALASVRPRTIRLEKVRAKTG